MARRSQIDFAYRTEGRRAAGASDTEVRGSRMLDRIGRWILWPLLKWGLIVSLPFLTLLRGTLYAYQQHWPTPLALFAGFVAAFLVLFLYTAWASLRVAPEGSAYPVRAVQWQALPVLVGLGALQESLLLTPDPVHVKSDEAVTEYAELHPLLRMGVGTYLLVDDHFLITDLSRHPSDYEDMGLTAKSRSLHYRQADGYAHAFDLHTKDQSWIRNVLTQGYFELLGFRTLRHVGTADHLHVALPMPPGSLYSFTDTSATPTDGDRSLVRLGRTRTSGAAICQLPSW